MATKKWKGVTILNKIMNVTNDEWPRIGISWFLQFFYRMGFVIGWTVLISLYITEFGIISLPLFFILYALFRIIGAFIFSNYINQFSKDIVILITALLGASCLFLSSFLIVFSNPAFILVSLPIIAVFFSQLYILNSAFIEDLFTPLESERTFPIIESSETIGGIAGGLIIATLANSIQPANFIYLVIISLVLIIPLILFNRQILKRLPFIHFKKKKRLSKINLSEIKSRLLHMKNIPFLKVLLAVVLIQWLFTNLLEFQYTKAVFQNISEGSSHVEQELTHGLGSLQILFHSFALIMQLLVASRIISSLGVIGSLLLHPVVTLFSLGTLLFKFGFVSAVVTKTNFEMTNIIHKNAYHTSYYAIEPRIREQVRELLEGFANPIGAIVGMSLLLILQNFFSGSQLTYSVTFLMIGVMLIMLVVLLKNETKYTRTSFKNLKNSNDPVLQLNAVEVLGEKGHRNAASILTRLLKQKNFDDKVKIKIIETLGHIKDRDSILEILDCLENPNKKIRLTALKALDNFDHIDKNITLYPFSNHRINRVLKDLFANEEDNNIKSLIIRLLAKINKYEVVPFIVELLKSHDKRLVADCISVCGSFKDINLVHYILPFLDSEDPRIRAQTIISLWQFKKYHMRLISELNKMIHSTDKENRLEGYRVVGEIGAIQEKNRLKASLTSSDQEERFVAAIALVKMGIQDGIPFIGDALLSDNELVRTYISGVQDTLPKIAQKRISKYIRQRVSEYINDILSNSNKKSLEELDKNTLIQLRKAYELVNEHEEVQNINDILNIKNETLQSRSLIFNPT